MYLVVTTWPRDEVRGDSVARGDSAVSQLSQARLWCVELPTR